jgi:hypothetical protein
MRYVLLVSAATGLALGLSGLGLADSQKDTYTLVANLRARSEVPKPKGVRTRASGLFRGTARELQGDQARLSWRLTFSRLTGRAVAAHIHAGKPGKAGNVLVALCGPCRSGRRGTAKITHAQLETIRSGGAYVNVHTAKNAAGEIRGQVKASGGSISDGSTTTTTTSTDPEPPGYPYP